MSVLPRLCLIAGILINTSPSSSYMVWGYFWTALVCPGSCHFRALSWFASRQRPRVPFSKEKRISFCSPLVALILPPWKSSTEKLTFSSLSQRKLLLTLSTLQVRGSGTFQGFHAYYIVGSLRRWTMRMEIPLILQISFALQRSWNTLRCTFYLWPCCGLAFY